MERTFKRRYMAYRSFLKSSETTAKFYESGFRTVCFLAGNTCNSLGEPYGEYPLIWPGPNCYEFEHLDRQIGDILSAAPDAELICIIDLNTPAWYVRRHVSGAQAYDSFDELGRTASSECWRKDTAEYLEAFLRHTETHYGRKIAAYVLAGGATCEWIDRSRGEESEIRFRAYREYCLSLGETPPEDIPPRSIRNRVSPEDRLRDPVRDAEALRYWRFTGINVRETVQFFLRKARTVLDEYRKDVELGTFFGYILHMGAESWNVGGGHLDYEELFRSPELDFVISPGIYHDREIGGGCGSQTPLLSLAGAGKRYLCECDQRTHTYNHVISKYARYDVPSFADEAATLAGMKREFAFSLIHNASLWFFDMWGGFYEGEKVFALIRRMSELWKQYAETIIPDKAEVLLVVDPESMLYVDFTNVSSYDYCTFIQAKMNKIGAPYRVCSFNDLEWMDRTGILEPVRLVIMANLFVVDDRKLSVLNRLILRNGRIVLWQYKPGIVRNGVKNEKNVQLLTGIPTRSAGVESRSGKEWTSILAHTPSDLDTNLIRSAGEQAHVHFCTPAGTVVYGNGEFLAIHTGKAGQIPVSLPAGSSGADELFTGKYYPGSRLACESEGPQTWLFHIRKGEQE